VIRKRNRSPLSVQARTTIRPTDGCPLSFTHLLSTRARHGPVNAAPARATTAAAPERARGPAPA
jgi:hypothetical protein